MSQAAEINYEAIALECNAICNIAKTEVSKIDQLLNVINERSSDVFTDSILSYQKELLKDKKSLLDDIDSLLSESNMIKEKGKVAIGAYSPEYIERNNIIILANELKNKANDLSTNKLQVMEHLIKEELLNIGSNIKEKIIKESHGIRDIKQNILEQINLIEDVTLRESTLKVARLKENENLEFVELVDKGKTHLKNLRNSIKENNKEKMVQMIKSEMVKAKVAPEIIEKTINDKRNIDELREQATKEIINEEVRKESLKIILKAIRERGFIVDPKKNIKINRETNEVLLVAQKASGQKAEFKIYLDGKFIYHFDGYEGQACQEDLQPFLEDLETIYGFKMEETAIIWSNPDKLTTKKYQAVDVNKRKR